eukprot:scaffold85761_cov55-Phaeocystis_antarctica.AAC.3
MSSSSGGRSARCSGSILKTRLYSLHAECGPPAPRGGRRPATTRILPWASSFLPMSDCGGRGLSTGSAGCTEFTVEAVRLAEVRDAPNREHHAAVEAREAGGGWLVDRAHDDDGAGLGDTSLSRLMVMTTEA